MTILANGVVENPRKRIHLGGSYTPKDRSELEAASEKELRKRLSDHDPEAAKNCPDKASLIPLLMGKPRDLSLQDRALCSFPMLQEIPKDRAKAHINVKPNSLFVRRRDNGQYGITHCWPIKYNEKFQQTFKVHATNPDPTRFSPRAAAEYLECMFRLFNPPTSTKYLFGKLLSGAGVSADHNWEGAKHLRYCTSTKWNERTTIIGTAEQIVSYLRARPKLQENMGILRMLPNGFVSSITINGKLDQTTKRFTMMLDDSQQVAYMKKGFEVMASVKPFDLFEFDCQLGVPLEETAESRAPAPGLAPNDRTSIIVLQEHEKDHHHHHHHLDA